MYPHYYQQLPPVIAFASSKKKDDSSGGGGGGNGGKDKGVGGDGGSGSGDNGGGGGSDTGGGGGSDNTGGGGGSNTGSGCFVSVDGTRFDAKIVHKGRGKFKILKDEFGGKHTNEIIDASDVVRCKRFDPSNCAIQSVHHCIHTFYTLLLPFGLTLSIQLKRGIFCNEL
ncbi:MAG TPA: hypothetical protein VJ729_08615 [Nitrososphaeraceae archaeon]|nr:hypothetical protein [Nitrososphaeraceae archaeon]